MTPSHPRSRRVKFESFVIVRGNRTRISNVASPFPSLRCWKLLHKNQSTINLHFWLFHKLGRCVVKLQRKTWNLLLVLILERFTFVKNLPFSLYLHYFFRRRKSRSRKCKKKVARKIVLLEKDKTQINFFLFIRLSWRKLRLSMRSLLPSQSF